MNKELITACMPVQDLPARMTVLYEEEKPVEVYIEPEESVSALGRIILGKVESVEHGLSAAFIRIGTEQRVYLPLSRHTENIRPGDEIPVQIIQEAQKSKLPKVTVEWEIAGNYMVLSGSSKKLTYSRKLTSEQKEELHRIAGGLNQEECGILFRTRAAAASREEIQAEFACLYKNVQDIRLKASSRPCYSILYDPPGLQQRIISRCLPGELRRFLTDDQGLAASLKDICKRAGCGSEWYHDPQIALFRLRNLSGLLDRLTSSTVYLRSGGSLVIEQTEAFAVIDVNTARFTGKKDPEETVRKINLEAAAEAARQIRLRQLSGTILIDFINSRDPKEEQEIGHVLDSYFFRDPVSTKWIDFTKLHICEITRRKTQRTLREQISHLKEHV